MYFTKCRIFFVPCSIHCHELLFKIKWGENRRTFYRNRSMCFCLVSILKELYIVVWLNSSFNTQNLFQSVIFIRNFTSERSYSISNHTKVLIWPIPLILIRSRRHSTTVLQPSKKLANIPCIKNISFQFSFT